MRLQLQYSSTLIEIFFISTWMEILVNGEKQYTNGHFPITQERLLESSPAEVLSITDNGKLKDFKPYHHEITTNNHAHALKKGKLDQRVQKNAWHAVFTNIYKNSDNPTTTLPILTTEEDTRLFDILPINLIDRDTEQGSFVTSSNKKLEDYRDINFVPAGSNTIIQVKKGPNGKEYEYEYVYYYYDEEDRDAARGVVSVNSSDMEKDFVDYNKYNIENSMTSTTVPMETVEPVMNEVILNKNGNKPRHLLSMQDGIDQKRLSTNTRFPVRIRSDHAVANISERGARMRDSRQRMPLAVIDSSNTSNLQEGPEFPQNLPNGPVRFLGVTPNESKEDMVLTHLTVNNQQHKNQSVTNADKLRHSQYQLHEDEDVLNGEKLDTFSTVVTFSSAIFKKNRIPNNNVVMDVTDSPTTEKSYAMDKVLLDLYVYLQQNHNNLVDQVVPTDNSELNFENCTTEMAGSITDESSLIDTDLDKIISTTMSPTTTPASMELSTTVINYAESSTLRPVLTNNEKLSTAIPVFGRSKFKRPALNSAAPQNHFKAPSAISSITETSHATLTSGTVRLPIRSRTRFPTSNFIRNRNISQKLTTSEPVLNENVDIEKVISKTTTARGRYRSTSVRSGIQLKSTVSPTTNIGQKLTGLSKTLTFGKVSILNRRRGSRPGVMTVEGDAIFEEQNSFIANQAAGNNSNENHRSIAKIAGIGGSSNQIVKSIFKANTGRINTRPKSGQVNLTTEIMTNNTVITAAIIDDQPGHGNEEEYREVSMDSNVAKHYTTVNSLNKLRNRNKSQAKITTATTLTARRSTLLPRRKSTEAPSSSFNNNSRLEDAPLNTTSSEQSTRDPVFIEKNISNKREEIRSYTGLLGHKRRLLPRHFK